MLAQIMFAITNIAGATHIIPAVNARGQATQLESPQKAVRSMAQHAETHNKRMRRLGGHGVKQQKPSRLRAQSKLLIN